MNGDSEATLSPRTLAIRRNKVQELILEAHALLRMDSNEHAAEAEGRLMSPERRRRFISLLVRTLHLVTEGWTS